MAVILNIDTSTKVCSVAVTAEGMILQHFEDYEGRNHASLLSDYIKFCLDFLSEKELTLDAVAVSMGPGSYTGLRIGLSEAKGLCYALDIPLIGINTLELMATRVMFSTDSVDPDSILVPMIDARRMEVYTAAYDFALRPIMMPSALILDGDAYSNILAMERPVLFFGDGMEKSKAVITASNAVFVDNVTPLAVDMIALAERDYAHRKFLDTAYSTPFYLKDFQATKPRNKVF